MRLHWITFFVKPHTMNHVFACIILAVCLRVRKTKEEKTIIYSLKALDDVRI